MENVFKELKSELDIRPLYVRNELSPRGHEVTSMGKELLKSARIKLPTALPPRKAIVDTRKKISRE